MIDSKKMQNSLQIGKMPIIKTPVHLPWEVGGDVCLGRQLGSLVSHKTGPVPTHDVMGPTRQGLVTETGRILTLPFVLGKGKVFPSMDYHFKSL